VQVQAELVDQVEPDQRPPQADAAPDQDVAASTLKPDRRRAPQRAGGGRSRSGTAGVLAVGDHQLQRRWHVLGQAGDRNEKDRVASPASQANQAGEPTATGRRTGCGSLELPVRHRGDRRHPLPRPIRRLTYPNAPNNTLMAEGQAQLVSTRHGPEVW